MGNKIEALAIMVRTAEQDAVALLVRYHEAIERVNRAKQELQVAVDEEVSRRRDAE